MSETNNSLDFEKNVYIKINSVVKNDDGDDSFDLMTAGTLSCKDGDYKLVYSESEATGLEGVTTTLLYDKEGRVSLLREGPLNSQMMMEKGVRHHCTYVTPQGEMDITTYANMVRSTLSENGGELEFAYTVDINKVYTSENHLKITVKEDK